ncbi:MAG: universal stress protein [Gammaproteobacteria bacterium]|nr:universal stress protein [Gammaproteobacteria bacterium]
MPARNVIVFPTDFSEMSAGALPWVRRMADQLQADVHVIYVVEEPHIYATLDMGPVPIPSVDELTRSAEKRMANFVDAHLKALGGFTTRVLVGRPAEQLVSYANSHKAALIVMTTHGYSGLKHVLLGSTTEAVLRHAACPVLSVRSG